MRNSEYVSGEGCQVLDSVHASVSRAFTIKTMRYYLLPLFVCFPLLFASCIYDAGKQCDDIDFARYCYLEFDINGDGVIDKKEASLVKEIDVRLFGVSSLNGIQEFPNLEVLDCSGNKLTSLDVRHNTCLLKLLCQGNQLTELDVSNNLDLELLNCGNNAIASINISNNTNLETFCFRNNKISTIGLCKNINLTSLDCNGNSLSELDLSANKQLVSLMCESNNLSHLNVSNNPLLWALFCKGNPHLKDITILESSPAFKDIQMNAGHLYYDVGTVIFVE